MRSGEQLDAMRIMGINHLKFLLAPRLFVCILFLPFLTLLADFVGIFGGYIVSVLKLNFNSALYESLTFRYLRLSDISSGLLKALLFGFSISFISYYFGYNAKYGASGVGKATRTSVVTSSISILILNYILTYLLFSI